MSVNPGKAPGNGEAGTASQRRSTHSTRRRRWYAPKRLATLWVGLPALAGLAFWALFGLLVWKIEGTQEGRYVAVAERSFVVRDFEEARIACERLWRMDSKDHTAHAYRMAVCLFGLGKQEQALALMSSIAPLGKPGFGPAHSFLGNILASNPRSDERSLQAAEAHLKAAKELQPDSLDLGESLGKLYARMGQWKLARNEFEKLVKARPELKLSLAVVAEAMGDREEMLSYARQAAADGEKQTQEQPESIQARLRWVDALMMLGEYTKALAVLESGGDRGEKPVYRETAARIIAARLQSTKDQPGESLAARLDLVQKGLGKDPKNMALLQELVRISHLRGKQGDGARAAVAALGRGEASWTAHLVLGMDALESGRPEEGQQHLELVYKLAPDMPAVANNLAWALAFGKTPNLQRAREIIDTVVRRFPDNPSFRDTRGKILAEMGLWNDAVADLQYALPWHRESAGTHDCLAKAYTGLGMKDLAAEHRRIADSLRAR